MDAEKNLTPDPSYDSSNRMAVEHFQRSKKSPFATFFSDFKRQETVDDLGLDDQTRANRALKGMRSQTSSSKKLTKRHAQVASIAGAIGTGLFIGSGNSLAAGGPGALLIGFLVCAIAVIGFMAAVGELGVRYHAPSFTNYTTRFIDPSWGFTVGWMYALCWLIVMPLELIASAMVIEFWKYDDNPAARVNPVAWVALFYAAIVFISLFGVRGYGEAEFLFSVIKVTATVGFIIFGVVVTCGGGPSHTYVGARYFHEPGSFAHGFKGVVVAIVNSAFAYGGTEVAGLAAAETKAPNRAFPTIVKQVLWRVMIFFVGAMLIVCVMVPYNYKGLGSSSNGTGSPFVLAIEIAGVRGLPSVFNAVIMISVFSVANASAFGATRALVSLSFDGHAPAFISYIDRRGRPLGAMAVSLTFGALCFLAASDKYGDVFNWLYAFVSLSFLFAWLSTAVAHLRHRYAFRKLGIPLEELLYVSPFGIWGSVACAIVTFMIIGFNGWLAIFPLGKKPSASAFFQQYLSMPVALVLFIGHKLITHSRFVRNNELDVTTNLRKYDMDIIQEENELHAMRKRTSILYRIRSFFC